MVLHPDKGGSKAEFQMLEDIYTIAKRGRAGLRELRLMLPTKIRLTASETAYHADKLGVFTRNAETIHDKPLYVNETNPSIALWWAPPDSLYTTGMWLIGRYDKRGYDAAYHIRSARCPCFEQEKAGRWETFSPISERFEQADITQVVVSV